MNFQKMTKDQLEAHGRTLGIELDKRQSKKNLIAELKKATKKPVAKKAPVKKAVTKKPVAKKAPTVIKPTPSSPTKTITPKLSVWHRLKKFFNI